MICFGCIPPTSWQRLTLHWRNNQTHQNNHQQYLLLQEEVHRNNPNNEDDNIGNDLDDNDFPMYDIENNDQDIVIEPPIYFHGPIPETLRLFHEQHPEIRQSESTLSGQVNPLERSQFYITIQRNFIKEVYHTNDINENGERSRK